MYLCGLHHISLYPSHDVLYSARPPGPGSSGRPHSRILLAVRLAVISDLEGRAFAACGDSARDLLAALGQEFVAVTHGEIPWPV
jgi:hypothetical protein